MSEEGVCVHIYTQTWGRKKSYVLGIVDGSVTLETPKETLKELADKLMELAEPGYQGEIPVHWYPPEHLVGKSLIKGKVPKKKRPLFAEALPEGVHVNLE